MFFAVPEVKSLSKYSEFGSHLGAKDFILMGAISVMLHVAGIVIYSMSPKEETAIIPVRVLNIKLSGGVADEMPDPSSMPDLGTNSTDSKPMNLLPAPEILPTINVDKTSPDSRHSPFAELARKRKNKTSQSQSTKDVSASQPKKYVREGDIPHVNTDDKTPGNGSGIAGTKEGQEIITKYEQVLSAWLLQHKTYPQVAMANKIEGSAKVRIRINREGHIIYKAIDSSSGNEMIDQAVIDMVNSSDPVPPVPENYPEGQEFEYIIPVSFTIK